MGSKSRHETGTRRKFVTAVLVGLFVGLGVSIFSLAWRAKKADLKSQTDSLHATFSMQLSQKESLLAEEQRQREAAETARALAEQDKRKQEAVATELKNSLAAAQLSLRAKEADAESSKAQALEKQAQIESLTQQLETLKKAGQDVAVAGASCADRHTPWEPSLERDAVGDAELAALLRATAVNNEVMVAISNRNYAGPGNMLDIWMDNVVRAGVKNAMVVALDSSTKDHVATKNFPVIEMHEQISEAQKGVGENHAVSGLKFRILKKFLSLGYAVLLSDVDIVTLQDPFKHLYRDSDVEAMSDGWDNATAYGYNDVLDDPSMGWARYVHSMRVFVFNSGLFYMRPTNASMALLDKVAYRIQTENGWDQALFNEVIFFPSHNDYNDPSVTRRVMDYMLFMNSKVLFKRVRHDSNMRNHLPVTVHVNYHPNKWERMKAVVERYVNGKMDALDPFPDGSEQ